MKFLDLYEITGSHLNEPETPAYTYGRYIPENDLDKKMLVQCAIATAKSIDWEFDRDDCYGSADLQSIKFDDHGFGICRLIIQRKPFEPLTCLSDSFSLWVTIWIDADAAGRPLAMWRIDQLNGQSNSLDYPPVIDLEVEH